MRFFLHCMTTGCASRTPHGQCLLAGRWTRSLGPWWPGPRWGAVAHDSVKKQQTGQAVVWRRRGGAVAVSGRRCWLRCAAFRAVLRRVGGRCPCCAGRRRGFVQFLDKVVTCPLLRRQVHEVQFLRLWTSLLSCSDMGSCAQ